MIFEELEFMTRDMKYNFFLDYIFFISNGVRNGTLVFLFYHLMIDRKKGLV